MSAPEQGTPLIPRRAQRRTGLGAVLASFFTLWRLAFRNSVSVWRVVLLTALGAGLIGLVALVANSIRDTSDRTSAEIAEDINTLINATGLGLMLPVIALLFASAGLGELRDEKSLVYVWLSPNSRALAPLATTLASFTIVAPITTASLVLSAWAADISSDYVIAILVAALLGSLAYCGLFMAGSLLLRRILGWGLGYVLIWEGTIAFLPGPLGQASVRRYTASIVADWAGVGDDSSLTTGAVAVLVLIVITVASVVAAAIRFNRMTID